MDYFTILNLDREPFSNSPDPDFFFQSRQHVDCLQKLELAIRLKRGLNIVIGAVGAGKTTLCRTLLKRFAGDPAIESHLILDPSFNSAAAFLESIGSMIAGTTIGGLDEHGFKEKIKHNLFQKGVDEKKTIVLIIDEGQKLPLFCLEILRELLNYETNDHKLLQIVLFAQEEFHEILDHRANLADRVNLIHFLGPMSLADTRRMIGFRIKHASSQPRPPKLFTGMALYAIYRATGGYPRKIINLCHQCMLALIVQNRSKVGWRLVRSCKDRSLAQRGQTYRNRRAFIFSALVFMAAIGMIYLIIPGWLPSISTPVTGGPSTTMPENAKTIHPPPMELPMAQSDRPVPSAQPLADVSTADILQPADEPPAARPIAGLSPSPPPPDLIPDKPGGADPVGEKIASVSPSQQTDRPKQVQPSLLGALTVKRNDTLGLMVKIIYGDFRERILQAVLDANPHIGHADAIRVGDTIAFPAFPSAFVQRTFPLWWLKVDQADSLDLAFRRSINAAKDKDAPLMRVITEWDPQAGLHYGIYVAGYFFNHAAAEKMMANLPDEFSGSAEIISGWTDQTVLFADPFLGKGY
ncbi:AAA family ATPase [Desulfosarcina sp.]|uniref:AAA family ATPase n=1 Tax=Desulfosarcina sp. TaxID=2027861 RepID=UPI003564AC2A